MPWNPVYDFFFENDFDAEFCNLAKRSAIQGVRHFEEFILRLHTGESVAQLRPGASTRTQCEAEGQSYLRRISETLIADVRSRRETLAKSPSSLAQAAVKGPDPTIGLVRSLELDGYVFRDGKLLHVESAVLDVEHQHGALMKIAEDLQLAELQTIAHHLSLSEEHYGAGRWDDSIGNARKFLECCLQECAALWSARKLGERLSQDVYTWPKEVRIFLQKQGLLSEKETKAIAETYGLLSETGSHPHIAANDQARMLRQIALVYSEFVMLRLQGALA